MYCNKCGASVDDNSKFCSYCGNELQSNNAFTTGSGTYFTPPGMKQPEINKNQDKPKLRTNGGNNIRQDVERPSDERAYISSPEMKQTNNENNKRVESSRLKQNEIVSQTAGSSLVSDTKPEGHTPNRVGALHYAKAYKGFNSYQEKLTAFIFVSPMSFDSTFDLINSVILHIGKVSTGDKRRGIIKGRICYTTFQSEKIEFYIAKKDKYCSVRAVLHGNMLIKAKDIYWDYFLSTLFAYSPDTDFGVTLCNHSPYLLAVNYVGSDTVLESHSVTSGGTSALGFLVGDALFGTAGAVVGGMSGRSYTNGSTREVFANRQLIRIVYNNGRIYEGEVKKGSQLYNEIMVNL